MTIRKATESDFDQVWKIFSKVIETGDTYVYDPTTPKSELSKLWFAPTMQTFVYEEQGKILGTYYLKPNQIDLGNHIANCGYMVSPKAQGKGIGKILCAHSLQIAKDAGFKGIQFNLVVSTNTRAIKLWEKFGFKIIGTIPKGFNHAKLGYVDAYIMFQLLE